MAGAYESGQALVETALTAPILLLMLVGGVEFGRVAYAAIEVANSAKAAVQYGAQNPGTSTDTTTMETVAVAERMQGTRLPSVRLRQTNGTDWNSEACEHLLEA